MDSRYEKCHMGFYIATYWYGPVTVKFHLGGNRMIECAAKALVKDSLCQGNVVILVESEIYATIMAHKHLPAFNQNFWIPQSWWRITFQTRVPKPRDLPWKRHSP